MIQSMMKSSSGKLKCPKATLVSMSAEYWHHSWQGIEAAKYLSRCVAIVVSFDTDRRVASEHMPSMQLPCPNIQIIPLIKGADIPYKSFQSPKGQHSMFSDLL